MNNEVIIPSVAKKKLDSSQKRLRELVEVLSEALDEHEKLAQDFKRSVT